MPTKLNRQTYKQLINEDMAWLSRQPCSLEAQHIIHVLIWSVDALFPLEPPQPIVPAHAQPDLETDVPEDYPF